MENRYNDILRKHNQEILNLCPYVPILHNITAFEIDERYKKGMKVLEIGCGEGDSTLPVLTHTNAFLDLLDVSLKMIDSCKKKLNDFQNRIHYICKDVSEYLDEAESYDIIYSSWTIHNFNQTDKDKLFRDIYSNLKKGGVFILADKVYPKKGGNRLLEQQKERFNKFLTPLVAKAIIAHEEEDATVTYRMDEMALIEQLKKIGFSKINLVDRVERDIVLVASK